MIYDNYMITGDRGDHPSSPYYRPRYVFTCDHCGMPSEDEGRAIKYQLEGEGEDAEPHCMDVCDSCFYVIQKSEQFILHP